MWRELKPPQPSQGGSKAAEARLPSPGSWLISAPDARIRGVASSGCPRAAIASASAARLTLTPARAPCVRSSLSVLPPLPGSLQPRRPGPRGGRAARGGAGRGAAQLLPQVTMLRTRLLPAPAVRPARPFLLGYFPPPSRNARAAALTYTCAGPAGFGNRPRKLAWGWVVGHRG